MKRLPSGFRRMLRLGSVDRDLDEELAAHREHTIEELVSRGRTREEAEAEAARRFGDEQAYRRALRAIDTGYEQRRRWRDRVDVVRQSVGYALRGFGRSPGLTLGIVLTFALGIGANATMYGIVERLILATPPHVANGDEVKRLLPEYYVEHTRSRLAVPTVSYPEYRELESVRAFRGVAGHAQHDVIVGRGENAEAGSLVWATGNFFELLGVQPARGRFYTPAEDRIGGGRVAVISHGYWQRKFGGLSNAVGQSIDFGYGPYTIIGVAPRGFTGIELARVDFWVPLRVAATDTYGSDWENDRTWAWFEPFARLAPEVKVERAAAEATAVHANGWSAHVTRGEYGKNPTVVIAPLQAGLGPNPSGEVLVARLLLGVSLMVLLIACVNVANLLLARTIKQSREIAVRLSLGISRARLIGQILLEGVLLAAGGALCALLIYTYGGDVIRHALLPNVEWSEARITANIAWVMIALTVFAGLLSALVPAYKAAKGELSLMLRQASAGGITRTTARVRTSLVLVQTALSVLLLVGASLFLRSLNRVHQLDLGFEVDGLYQVTPRTLAGSMNNDERSRLYALAQERLAQLPGIEAVGMAATYPFHSRRSAAFRAEGVDSISRPTTGGPYVQEISSGYAEAMGLRILRGRGLLASDDERAPRVALVNRGLAQWLWRDQSPIGKCIYIGQDPRCSEVVGVIEDAAHFSLTAEMPLQYYVPLAQKQLDGVPRMLVLRADRESAELSQTLLREVVALDSRVRYADVEPMRQRLAPVQRSWTLGAIMFSVFGALGLLVASLGLYSVLAFDVVQRTREIGLRAALGASRERLLRMVVQQAVWITILGIAVGVLAALLLGSRVQPMLFQVNARDPITFGVVATTLIAVAIIAGLLPGWRAARVQPSIALRAD
jgi:putative ABC transport system permease protein